MKKIMIVDDEPNVLELLSELLESKGIKADTYNDALTCLEDLKKGKVPDLLILDIRMPKLSGLEMCRRIREDLKLEDLKIVFLTASQYKDIKDKYNVLTYLYKPFDIEDLVEKITKFVE